MRCTSGTATTQITEIRRQSLTLMAATFERTRTLLRDGDAPITSAPVRDPLIMQLITRGVPARYPHIAEGTTP